MPPPRRRPPTPDADLPLPPIDGDEAPGAAPDEAVPELEPPRESLDADDEADASLEHGVVLADEDGASWLERDERDDELDVGDADEIGDEDAPWIGDDPPASLDHDGLTDDDASGADDGGEEGPEADEPEAMDDSAPVDTRDEGDEAVDRDGHDDPPPATEPAPPAFALDSPARARLVRIEPEGAVFAAALGDELVLLAGEGVYALPLAALATPAERVVALRAAARPADDVLTSVACVGPRAFVAATALGQILRSDDGGVGWKPLGALGARDGSAATVELAVEPAATVTRLWARAHGGGLFRSEDGGASWDGPLLEPPARALAVDRHGGGVVVATSGLHGALLRSRDGRAWRALPTKLPATPVAAAVCGDVIALAVATGPGLLSADGGATFALCALLEGATALCLVDTDDGAVQLLAAVYDPASEHCTLVCAAVSDAGLARGACRVADVDALLPSVGSLDVEEPEVRVEALLPLDPAGHRLLVLTPRGVVALTRDVG